MTTAQLQQELSQLDSQLAAKLAAMQSVSIHPALKENYDKKVQELEAERRELQQERRELLRKLDTLQHESGGWLGGWVARVVLEWREAGWSVKGGGAPLGWCCT
jgi:hypothetical protein